MNIVSTVMTFLTPMITNRIASALGINNALVTTAIGALVPSILAALVGKAATPGGAAALSDVLGKQDPGLLGSLGGPGQGTFVNSGTEILGSLLGGNAAGALAGALGKFAGVDPKTGAGLIGMLAPVVLGSLAQTQKSSGLDAGGLARMLEGQKANIAAAVPPGFAQLLGGTGLLDSIAGNMKAAAPAAPKMAAPAMPAMPPTAEFNWLPWAAAAAALLVLFWAFGGSNTRPPVPVEKAAVPAPAMVAAKDAMDRAKGVFATLTSTLGNVKDAATAQSALPQLTASSTALDGLGKLADGLAPDAKAQLRALVAATLPQFSPLVENVLKIPGVDLVLKPVMDAIMAKLTGLTKI